MTIRTTSLTSVLALTVALSAASCTKRRNIPESPNPNQTVPEATPQTQTTDQTTPTPMSQPSPSTDASSTTNVSPNDAPVANPDVVNPSSNSTVPNPSMPNSGTTMPDGTQTTVPSSDHNPSTPLPAP